MDTEERFHNLCKTIEAKGDINSFYQELVKHYSEPHRKYHNMDHIAQCLSEFDEVKDTTKYTSELEFALFYHDMIYDVFRKDNEEQSAEFAFQIGKRMALPETFREVVHDLILITEHYPGIYSPDAKIIADIDLSILGKSPEEFDEYERKIKEEYAEWIKEFSENAFKNERVNVLAGFLSRRIYQTDYFYNKYEEQARKNLKRSIDGLGV